MSRASQHPSERDRPGLQMALAALERRERIYPGAAGIPRLLLEQISNPYTVLEPSYDALQAERDQLRAQVEEQLPRLIDENHKLRAELDAIRGQQIVGRVHHNPDHPEPVRAVLNSAGRQLPDDARLYALPPRQPDAVSLQKSGCAECARRAEIDHHIEEQQG